MNLNISIDKDNYATLTEPNGNKRIIPPLHHGQMIRKNKTWTKFWYDKSVPENYWEKHDFLESRGWSTYYHFDNWQKGDFNDKLGISTEDALIEEGYYFNG